MARRERRRDLTLESVTAAVGVVSQDPHLLKAPAFVVLDEATSHLDSENEALIQQALAVALAGRTAVVIAHRLSTIAAADQILVLDGGRIVEQGRHTDLLRAGGL